MSTCFFENGNNIQKNRKNTVFGRPFLLRSFRPVREREGPAIPLAFLVFFALFREKALTVSANSGKMNEIISF